jgi:hypothetical protein
MRLPYNRISPRQGRSFWTRPNSSVHLLLVAQEPRHDASSAALAALWDFHSAARSASEWESSWSSGWIPPVWWVPRASASGGVVVPSMTPTLWIFFRLLVAKPYVFLCFWHGFNFLVLVVVDEEPKNQSAFGAAFPLGPTLRQTLPSSSIFSFLFCHYQYVCQVFLRYLKHEARTGPQIIRPCEPRS